MKEHIDKMTKVLVDYTEKNHIMESHVILEDYAEQLYNAGCRKQEWISVMDELPEMYADVLYFDGQSIGVDFICSDGTWCDEEVRSNKVTHWMPLPKAPKMKGGAE